MKAIIAIFGILYFGQLLAVEGPKVVEGDYLLVYAQIINIECTADLQAIEAGVVDEDGFITLFEDMTVMAKERPIHEIRKDLLDLMEQQTGHRSETLELHYLSGANDEIVAKRLLRFLRELRTKCYRTLLPPGNYDPKPDWESNFEKFAHSTYDKSLKSDAVSGVP